jgi:uncharacterized metal-binding protein YceD (DUF177 family)
MTEVPEFSRTISVDAFGSEPVVMAFAANPGEREALARRFGILEIASLKAEAAIVREGRLVRANGTVCAEIKQSCVVSGEALDIGIDEPFDLRFTPDENLPESEEIELSEIDCETLTYGHDGIELGEAIAQTMALAIDPFPRSPNADSEDYGLISEEEAGPFGALKGLRDAMQDDASKD